MRSDTKPKSVPYPQEVAEACARITSEIDDALRDIPRVARTVEDDPHAHGVRIDVLVARLAEAETSVIPQHRLIVYQKDGYIELPQDWRSGLLRVTAVTDAKRITSGCALRMSGTVTLVQTEWRGHPADAGDTGWYDDDHELRCFTQDFWIRPMPLLPEVWHGAPVAVAVEPRIPLVVIDFYPTVAIEGALRWSRVVTRDAEGGKILQVLRDVDTLTAGHGGTPGSGIRGIAQRALGEFWARDLARGATPEKYTAAERLATLLAGRSDWHVDDEARIDAAIVKLTGDAWWGSGYDIYTFPNAAFDADNEILRQIDRQRCGIPEGRPKVLDLRNPVVPAPAPVPAAASTPAAECPVITAVFTVAAETPSPTPEPKTTSPIVDCQIEASPEGAYRAVIAVTSGAPHATTRVTYGPWRGDLLAARRTVNSRLFEIIGTSGEDLTGWTPWHPAPPNRVATGMSDAVHRTISAWTEETNRLTAPEAVSPATAPDTLDVTLTVEKRDHSAFEPRAMPEWRGCALFTMKSADPAGVETVIGGAEGPWRDSEARAVRSFADLLNTFLHPTKVHLDDVWTFHLSGIVPTSADLVASVTRALEDLPKEERDILSSRPEDSVLLRSLDHTVQGVACAATHAATARLSVPDWKTETPTVMEQDPADDGTAAFIRTIQEAMSVGESVADVLEAPADPPPVDTSCWPSDGSVWSYTYSARDIRQPVRQRIAVVEWARSGMGWHIQGSRPYQSEPPYQSEDDGNPPNTGAITARYTNYRPEKVVLPRMTSRWRNRDTGVEGVVVYNDASTAWCLRGADGVRLTVWTWDVGDTFRAAWSEIPQDPNWVGAADEIIRGAHVIHDSILVDVGTGDVAGGLPTIQAAGAQVLADMSPIEMGPEDSGSTLASVGSEVPSPVTVTEMHWFRSRDGRRWSLRVPAKTPGETWHVIACINDHPADARIEWWVTLPEASTRGNLDRDWTPPQQPGVHVNPVIVRARGLIEAVTGMSPTLVVDRFGSPVTFGARKG